MEAMVFSSEFIQKLACETRAECTAASSGSAGGATSTGRSRGTQAGGALERLRDRTAGAALRLLGVH